MVTLSRWRSLVGRRSNFFHNGVQQGDPLGAFLFAAGLQSILAPIVSAHSDLLSKYVLDDGLHVGELNALDHLLRDLAPRLASSGLRLNLCKCRLYTKGDTSNFQQLRSVPLNAAIGSEQFLKDSLTATFAKALDFCDQVEKVDGHQTCHQLLRMCAGTCRVLHLMKVVPPAIMIPFVRQ